LFDIDHFKWVNDHLGHARGDDVLQAVAQVTREVADTHGARVYRYGGEEFAVVFALGTSPHQAFQAIDTMRQAVAGLGIAHAGSPFGVVTASFGVIAYPASIAVLDVASEHPCVKADKLLYAAKHAGRHTVASAQAERVATPSNPAIGV
jgi:diguanylate cyclase (GGDEF)-like protein